MRTLACVLVAVVGAGCDTDDSEDGPIITQGGLPPVSRPGEVRTITGTVCVIQDLQDLASCSVDLGGGLTVSLGSVATLSDVDGTFTMTVPADLLTTSLNPTFSIAGPGVIPSAFPLTVPFSNVGGVPVLDAAEFARTLTSNGVPLGFETGAILASVRGASGPLAGVTVRSTPASAFGPFFDAATSTNWGVDGTGMRGVVLIPGLTAGMVDLSFAHIAGGLETQVAGVTVRNGGVTILDTELIGF